MSTIQWLRSNSRSNNETCGTRCHIVPLLQRSTTQWAEVINEPRKAKSFATAAAKRARIPSRFGAPPKPKRWQNQRASRSLMQVRFIKESPEQYRLECTRRDGSKTAASLE